ncbi:MAG: 1,4-dihydroxy-2-naphthoate octaprenyltransferase [Candidatus Kapabacteria bacterium]|nr:1,4-dihydroxy-2-naphthoate octaprenyltransferase [Candidatus Kapabacteria bacterium]
MSEQKQINKSETNKLNIWIQAFRPFAYSASVTPVILAAMLALSYKPNETAWFLFPVILICAVLFHTGANLVSEYFDYKNQVDKVDTFGSSRVLVEGLLQPKQVLNAGIIAFAIGFILGLVLVYFRGTDILILGLIGLIGGYFYTAKPFQFKYIALGDLLIFLLFGPLLVLGAYLGLTGDMNYYVLYVSIPVGFLVVAILHANNTRDIKFDKRAKIKTLAMLVGLKGAKFEYYFLIFGAFLSVILLIIFKVLSPWSLLVFLSLPPALKNVKIISKADSEDPSTIAMLDVQTAQHHMIFGLLLSIGILISYFI